MAPAKSHRALFAAAAAILAIAGVPASYGAAQETDLTIVPVPSNDYVPAKTPWGEPDFRGGWPIDHLNSRTPLERDPAFGKRVFLTDAEFAEREETVAQLAQRYENEDSKNQLGIGHWAEVYPANRRTSWIIDPPDGRLPAKTEEGVRLSKEMRSTWRQNQPFDWTTDFDSWDRCITRGLPASMFPFMYNNGMRIFQAPGIVALQMEMVHETRIIPTDGRPAIPNQIHNWMGESRGHWENGNTLVVETDHFNGLGAPVNVGTWGSPPGNNTPQSDQAKLVERFIMTGPDAIVYEATYSDPVIYTAPWTVRLDWQRNSDYQLFEYACHEGNVQLRGYITSSRAQRGLQNREEAQ
jgi:hypothetical protein